jgi:hypothetical protein
MKKIALIALLISAPAFAAVTNTTTYADAVGTGAAHTFNFTFPCPNKAWIEVFVSGAKLASGYTVTLNVGSPGGSVYINSAPAQGVAVRIQRTVPLTQETVFNPYSAFPAKTAEGTFDTGRYIDQQLQRQITAIEAGIVPSVTYSAGAKLKLVGTTFSWDESDLVDGQTWVYNGAGGWEGELVRYAAPEAGGLKLFNNAISLNDALVQDGQFLKWNASQSKWLAANDLNTTYTVITDGGLRLSTTSFGFIPCAENQVLKATAVSGKYQCAADNNTTYSASNGVMLAGTDVQLEPTGQPGDRTTFNGSGQVIAQPTGVCTVTVPVLLGSECLESLPCSEFDVTDDMNIVASINGLSTEKTIFLQRTWSSFEAVNFMFCNFTDDTSTAGTTEATIAWAAH